MLALRPQAVAYARLQAPCAAGTLGSGGAGDALGLQAGHAATRIEARHPRQAGVDHHPYAVDGQAGLGDVGRQHHLARAPRRRLDGGALGGEVELAMQRAEQHLGATAKGLAQAFVNAADLGLAGRKTSTLPLSSASAWSTACCTRGSMNSPGCAARPQRISTGNMRPSLRTTGASPSSAARRSPSRVADITSTFSGGSSRNSSRPLRVSARARSASRLRSWNSSKITQADTVQRRGVLQATGKDTLGDHFDAGLRADPALQADPVADGLADLFAQLGGQPLGAARAAGRRGSSMRMRWPASQGSSSRASGTRVVLPAPGGAPGRPGVVRQGPGAGREQRRRWVGNHAGSGLTDEVYRRTGRRFDGLIVIVAAEDCRTLVDCYSSPSCSPGGRHMRLATRVSCAVLSAALLSQLSACGTLFYPERRGQIDGRIDPAIVAFDAIGLLFYIIPGTDRLRRRLRHRRHLPARRQVLGRPGSAQGCRRRGRQGRQPQAQGHPRTRDRP